ncbi:MAG: hypothetical protein QOC89_2934, partial [Paraburkholderia sp.]|uniref:hypothetical protein n=1 Tax=Paraburkholderia sp. TaxID=1926495 RepID=UPI002AFE466F
MAASSEYLAVDKVTCVSTNDTFEIRFSRGYRIAHLAVSIWLTFLSAFFTLTLFAAFRLQIAFDNWWGWLPLAFCSFAAIMHRFFTQGFTRSPVRIDRAGRVRCGYRLVRFSVKPAVCLAGPASNGGRFVCKGPLREKSRIALGATGGTRVTIFKTKNDARARRIAESLSAWLGQTEHQVLKSNGDVRLARCLTIMCVVDVIASLSMQWNDHQVFHPVHMGTLALVFAAALSSALLVLCMTRLWVRWRDRSVMVTAPDRVVQSALVLLAVAAVGATAFHFANLAELRSRPMQSRTSRTIIESVGMPKKDCASPLYFIEPRL